MGHIRIKKEARRSEAAHEIDTKLDRHPKKEKRKNYQVGKERKKKKRKTS